MSHAPGDSSPPARQSAVLVATNATPSPVAVAAAGRDEAFPVFIVMGLVTTVLVALVGLLFSADRLSLLGRLPPIKATDVLVDRAETIRRSLGYIDAPGDWFSGFTTDGGYIRHIDQTDQSQHRWDRLRRGRPAVLQFWYRTSPQDLVTVGSWPRPTLFNPPRTVAGMTTVITDTQGRLIQFEAVPSQLDEPTIRAPFTEWHKLFAAAELPMTAFTQAKPTWKPASYADTRVAWEGTLAEDPSIRVRIEAAAENGRPVYFSVVLPWMRPNTPESISGTTWRVIGASRGLASVALLIGAGFLARRHVTLGRSDRRGAARVAVVVIALNMAAWIIGAHHYSDALAENSSLVDNFSFALFLGFAQWVLYLALEPIVRRWQPHMLVGWARLLSGRFRDPQVGFDVLAGIVCGCLIAHLIAISPAASMLVGAPPVPPALSAFAPFFGVQRTMAGIATDLTGSMNDGMLLIVALVVIRILVKRTWLTVAVIWSVVATIETVLEISFESPWPHIVMLLVSIALMIAIGLQFGLLTTIVTFFVFALLRFMPLTVDVAAPYFAVSMWTLGGIFGLTAFAAHAALGRQRLLRIPDE